MSRLHLVVPEDWRQIPLHDGGALTSAVRAVVDRQFRGMEDQPLLKRDAVRRLTETASEAASQGGVELYLSFAAVAGIPVATSLLVSLVPAPPGHVSLRSVARELSAAGDRTEVVELPFGTAVRRQRVVPPAGPDVPQALEVVACDYYLKGPEGTLLLLAFSSPLAALADPLAELFEAVAATARWTES